MERNDRTSDIFIYEGKEYALLGCRPPVDQMTGNLGVWTGPVRLEIREGQLYLEGEEAPLYYEGKLALGTGLLEGYTTPTGEAADWAYEEVLEFVFKDGSVESVTDVSAQMKSVREMMGR